jgi:hypothetical protein
MLSITCPRKQATKDQWIMVVYENGIKDDEVVYIDKNSSISMNFKNTNTSTKIIERRYPVVVHVNFCNGKTIELQARGLWLVIENEVPYVNTHGKVDYSKNKTVYSCLPFDARQTYYGRFDWSKEVDAIRAKRKYIYDEFVKNGSLIQSLGNEIVYLVDVNLKRKKIPDGETFIQLGFEWPDVRVIPSAVMKLVQIGEPVPSLKIKSPPTLK